MKKYRITLLLVVVSFFLSLSISFFLISLEKENTISSLLLWQTTLIVFIASLVIIAVLHFFVFNKLSQLLQNVKNYRNQNDKNSSTETSTNNIITALNNEINAWAQDRKNEIERLNKLEVYRKEFLGNVSHELKTPVFNIQGYILTLLDGGLEDKTINRNYLQRAEKSVDRMIAIIDDLEAISQLETGELKIEPERFDITLLIKEIVDAQEMKASENGIILSFQDDTKSVYVFADRFRIRQVLVNLIVNSTKYGKEYGETKIKTYDTGEKIIIEVADNGIGIEEKHLPRLFERFYRVDKSRSREQGGTGLGLSIVKHIIEAHNQSINVMSTVGVGTVFTFTLKKG